MAMVIKLDLGESTSVLSPRRGHTNFHEFLLFNILQLATMLAISNNDLASIFGLHNLCHPVVLKDHYIFAVFGWL